MLKGREVLIFLAIKHNGNWDDIYRAIMDKEDVGKEEVVLETLGNLKCKTVTLIDSDYPEALKSIYKPPFVLFYYGDLNLVQNIQNNIAIVGSRQPLPENLKLTREIVSDLASTFNVVSGLAKGIDAVAFESVYSSSGKGIGVLGGGIDYIYPRSNIDLFELTKEKGLLISEYPNAIPPEANNFPFRNRIIAALGRGVFIPDIKERSGTYSTLCHAISLGKDVFVLVQPANSNTFNNSLIKEGACLVEKAKDITDELKV